ncbi:uncharacterized protein LOC103498043 [Cucumis melo]|uniref:Uncharacterized protein LOC103498043 n=1 Tax=Cucumis melo TaxID=3656 RepID=A0A1S3C8L7_CUCME|nr:uncharacterized protein LOC103498043 [Cucumis melo]
MEIFPPSFWDFIYLWEPSAALFLSLCVQLVLVPMGLKRKHSSSQFLRFFLLIAYSFSDWIANFSFVMLVERYGTGCYDDFTDPNYIIRAFLAHFLLLHLGGFDTITAYSMEDNELWLRTLLSLLAVLAASIYIFLQALLPTSLNYVSIPVIIAGIIKNCEKIWALRSASAERLRDFLAVSTPSPITTHNEEEVQDFEMLHIAYYFFNRDKRLFVGLGPTSYDLQQNRLCYYEKFQSNSAFKIIELELGFMYDFFYTKASINHSLCGRLFRLTTFSSLFIAILTYCLIDKQEYPSTYVNLIFLLFFGALSIEIYSLFLILFSDWNVIWLLTTQSPSNPLPRLALKLISLCGWSFKKRRCSNSISQYNLISHCLKQKNDDSYYCKFHNTKTMAAFSVQRPISNNLEAHIFQQLKKKLVLNQEYDSGYNEIGWSLKLDLDQSILLWHIATDFCYYSSPKFKESEEYSESCIPPQDSISLSNFLAYFIVHHPSLFPSRMSQIRHKATSEDVLELLQDKKLGRCNSNMLKNLELKIEVVKEERKESMVLDACRLAGILEKLEQSQKWEIIGNVWVELLGRISCEFEWYDHAKHLTQGGNLVTRVWILMHHLGCVKPNDVFTMHMQEDQQDTTPLLGHDIVADYVVEQMLNVIFNNIVSSL